jgi:hypothetical protein
MSELINKKSANTAGRFAFAGPKPPKVAYFHVSPEAAPQRGHDWIKPFPSQSCQPSLKAKPRGNRRGVGINILCEPARLIS